jgi:hypothetical protein
MLSRIEINGSLDPIVAMIAQMNGQSASASKIQRGYFNSPLNFDNIVESSLGRRLDYENKYPSFDYDLDSYGVCDSPQQFIDKFNDDLEKDERQFVVGFAHILKNSSNAGEGGGWRWHKWGQYIGEGDPQCEYLDDEEGFEDGVYVYDIVQI